MSRRPAIPLATLLGAALLGATAALAQQAPPPLPVPPVRQGVLCSAGLERLLDSGLEGRRDGEDRAAAAELIAALDQNERDRLVAEVERELGPLAFSLYVPGETSPGEKLLDRLSRESCIRDAVKRGVESADAEVRARSQQLRDRLATPAAPPDRWFMSESPASAQPGAAAQAPFALRLELPPSDLVVPGHPFAGRVIDDSAAPPRVGQGAFAPGLLVNVAGQIVRVTREGRFVARAPAAAGAYPVELRHQDQPLLAPVEAVLTIPPGASGARTDRGSRPAVDCEGFDSFLDAAIAGSSDAPAPARCRIAAPAAILPDQRLVVLGQLDGDNGLATRAFVGPWEAPLLAKTPIAAIFDVSAVPAGPQTLTVFEGGRLIAAAHVDRVTMTARSDRSELARGEVATFTVRVEGLPLAARGESASNRAAPNDAGTVAFLDYANGSPEVGHFRDQADHFSVPIPRSALERSPPVARALDQHSVIARIEGLIIGALGRAAAPPGAAAPPRPDAAPTEPAAGAPGRDAVIAGSFDDAREYRGSGVGDYHVRIAVRLPAESMKLLPAIAPSAALDPSGGGGAPPRVASSDDVDPRAGTVGVDDRGSYAEVDGQRLYFTIGYVAAVGGSEPASPKPDRLGEAACSGTCQCEIQSWEHAAEVGEQVRALDRSRPTWRAVTASARGCVCEEARAQCYGLLSSQCKARCKSSFESGLTEHVSGFAVGAEVGACADVGVCKP